MDLSKEASLVFQNAIAYANKYKYEYVTPEMILLMILDDDVFAEAFEECGGNLTILSSNLQKYVSEYVDKIDNKEILLSTGTNFVLNFAGQSAYSSGSDMIHVRHLVHAIWNLENSYAVYYMEQQDITEADVLQQMAIIEDENAAEAISEDIDGSIKTKEDKAGLSLYAPCLNDVLTDANPLIGREKELERTIQILCRKDKNNPLHIGETGVGKTAITYGLVQRLKSGDVPDAIKGAKVFSLDLGGMLAGTQYRGDFEKRFKKVLTEIGKEEKPIIYIDEIHNLAGAGAVGEGSFDASNMLKPYLTDGHIRFIGATTFEEYKKYFEKNKGLVRRFQNVEIKEPTEEETVEILNGLKAKYEKYHGVKYAKGLMEYAAHMSAKFINERYLPDKAIDLIDEAGSYRKLHPLSQKTQTVDKTVRVEFYSNDNMAAGALTALKDNGIAIPLHLSIIGFDDIPIARYTDPQLTTVRYPIASMAKLATELALQGAADNIDPRASHCFMPTLVRRHSVATRQNAAAITNSTNQAM